MDRLDWIEQRLDEIERRLGIVPDKLGLVTWPTDPLPVCGCEPGASCGNAACPHMMRAS